MIKQRKQPLDWHRQLLELVHSTSLATDFQGALSAFVEGTRRLVGCTGVSLMWLEGDHLQVLSSCGETSPLKGLVLPASQMGAARAVLDSSRTVIVTDTSKDARWRPVPGEEQAQAWLGTPLLFEDRTIGLLEWTDRQLARFDREDIEIAEELAHYLMPPLYWARLLDDTRKRLREMVEPQTTAASRSPDMAVELQPVVQEAQEYTDAQHAFVFLMGEQRDSLRCIAAAGEQMDRLRRTTLLGDGTLVGWDMAVSRGSNWLGSGPSDRKKLAALGIEHSLILPLRVAGEPVGVLGVAEPRQRRSFEPDAIRLMTHLASQASLIVERTYRQKPQPAGLDYEMILQSSPLGVGVLTVKGDIRVCNPALAGLLSQTDQPPIGRNLTSFLVLSDAQRLRHALEEVAITGHRRQVEARIQPASGDLRYTRMSLAFAHIAGDLGGNIVLMVEDISPLKILEEERVEHLRELREKHAQLQELDRLKSRFVSNVSHELRTPLAVIKLYATLARKGRPEKKGYYLQTIEQETHRLETMVENILDLTRLDRQALNVNMESLAAEEVVGQVLEVYEENAKKRGVALSSQVEEALPPLLADKNHLIQMLTNLLDNALKFTPKGGEVWVSVRRTGAGSRQILEIAVGDSGAGIPEDEQDKVFERFYRGSNNEPGSTGTGLGLAIVRELMVQHGGKVTLTSKVGEGSVFTLQFPLRLAETNTGPGLEGTADPNAAVATGIEGSSTLRVARASGSEPHDKE